MRKKKYFKIKLWLFMLIVLISSCESDQEPSSKAKITDPAVMEAKNYFENNIVAILPEDESKNLLYPGMFAPIWYKAERIEKSGTQYIEIPFESTFRFRIGQEVWNDKKLKKQNVTAWQKMVMIKNLETNEYSSYFATLVPTREYFVKHKNMDPRALNIYSDNNDFSGKVIFTTMDKSKIIRINSLKDGKTTSSATLSCPKEERASNIKKINKLLSGISITKRVKATTRGWEMDGGWLDEVVVTPDDDDDYDWEDDDWWDPYPDDNYDWYDDWYDENDGGGGSSGSSGSNDQDPHIDFDITINKVISELNKLGIQISKTVFKKSDSGCAANARVIIDPKTKIKHIEICPEFYRQPLKNRIAITYHENYHLKNGDYP